MYIARQPILDRERRIAGYELLFRPAGGGPVGDPMRASATVAARAFADPAFADLLGPHPAFINVDADFLASDLVELLPARRTVLELLETIEFTPATVARCRELKARGFRLAADDWAGDRAAIAPVLGLLDIVKVDVPMLAGGDAAAVAHALGGVTLLAEKVETAADYERFATGGFALFQGYYFARPETFARAGRDPQREAALEVLALVLGDASEREIERAFKRHPALVVGLLRLVNSAAAGLARPIGSLREALVHLGRTPLRLWLQLLVYVGAGGADPASDPLLQTAAARAKTMEALAQRLGRAGERAFLVGIVSLFDAATGLARAELARRLALDAEIRAALVEGAGPLGALLALAEALERDDAAAAARLRAQLPALSDDDLAEATRAGLAWAAALGRPRKAHAP
ncbi:MAG: EAL domain-containing protein [Burkholderiales bacterium]|nr:EAL domain-containing protein [Burkholderiales bacterium]